VPAPYGDGHPKEGESYYDASKKSRAGSLTASVQGHAPKIASHCRKYHDKHSDDQDELQGLVPSRLTLFGGEQNRSH